MKTFNEIWTGKVEGPILDVLRQGTRSYLRDNLDPSSERTYLEDFLAVHGDEVAREIAFSKGTPHAEGVGIYFPSPTKVAIE